MYVCVYVGGLGVGGRDSDEKNRTRYANYWLDDGPSSNIKIKIAHHTKEKEREKKLRKNSKYKAK